MIHTITASHTLSMGHRLPSYNGICSSPHGHNITVTAEIRQQTFLDFKTVSAALGEILADFDHAMVLVQHDIVADFLVLHGFRVVLFNVEPSTEVLAQHVFNELRRTFPSIQRVTVQETAKYTASVTGLDESVERVL